jgi:hypothetical protein
MWEVWRGREWDWGGFARTYQVKPLRLTHIRPLLPEIAGSPFTLQPTSAGVDIILVRLYWILVQCKTLEL